MKRNDFGIKYLNKSWHAIKPTNNYLMYFGFDMDGYMIILPQLFPESAKGSFVYSISYFIAEPSTVKGITAKVRKILILFQARVADFNLWNLVDYVSVFQRLIEIFSFLIYMQIYKEVLGVMFSSREQKNYNSSINLLITDMSL